MQRTDFSYDLPEKLIAHRPAEWRSASRLLGLGRNGEISESGFADLPDRLRAGDLLVCNDTRVIRARLEGRKATGGRIEVLVERMLDDSRMLAQVRASKSPAPGSKIILGDQVVAEVVARHDDLFEIRLLDAAPIAEVIEAIGHVPLPPYINRPDTEEDASRYQTVYASRPGAVAAPTAGLHFDEPLLAELRAMGVEIEFVTLHVGAGTFQPVRVDVVEEHTMHAEYLEVSAEVCARVASTRARGGRVIAVGTTSVRALETASRDGSLKPYSGETDIFIYPGYQFRSVDILITNFHLPESTLLMLVCAFAGTDKVLSAYRYAIKKKFRFFSYGDAMFIEAPANG